MSFFTEQISFGKLRVPRVMAAPLDGVTDSPLRQLIRHFSPTELLMGEMRHVSQVANEKNDRTVSYNASEQPLAFQFSANRLDFMEKAVERVLEHKFVMINLNCGCPAPAVTRSGSGSALMADPDTFKILATRLKELIGDRVPFTVKIRAGYKQKNAVDFAKLAVDCGADGIMIHPRTQPEGFTSRLDYDLTAAVKKAINVPLIFSGNISRFDQAQRVYEKTGVDGFMIGRALWGAPWKMREITDAAQGKTFTFSTVQVLEYALKHLDLNMQFYGPRGFIPFKKQVAQYIRSAPNAATWRKNILISQTEPEMRAKLEQIIIEAKNQELTSPDTSTVRTQTSPVL
ncbi:MAG: tRNA-dihydrouridine synthase [Epsilonproteobacteria bacterium]|nr:tRNA-dihydrouridine synthase [Campylobacterota bacterium]